MHCEDWASVSGISAHVCWYVLHVLRTLGRCVFCYTGHKREIYNIQGKFSAFSIVLYYFELHICELG